MPAVLTQEDCLSAAALRRLCGLWLAFCAMKISGAVLLYSAELGLDLWKPLLWESSSLFVVTVLVVIQLKCCGASRHLHAKPWLWLRNQLFFFPLMCLIFVPATYGIRHAVYSLLGQSYHHGPWLRVFVYESMSLCIFYLLWLGVIFGFATREHFLAEQLRTQETALALREARLALLRQQLQPHFLFNALNLISAAMYENVPGADTLLRKLASLLRQASAQTEQATHSLHDELVLLRDYADIMTARFEGRVVLTWDIAEGGVPSNVPSMISQPLLENAFKYGVEPLTGTTHLEVRLSWLVRDRLRLSILQNRGKYDAAAGGHGQGLANVRRRLAAHYGQEAGLQISSLHPEGVCASITIPCAS